MTERPPVRIIVAAFDTSFRSQVCRIVTASGRAQIIGAVESAAQALDLALSQHPDLVLTDMAIGGANGLMLTRQIKSVQPTIPVILLTGLDASEYLAVARSSGVDRCLTRGDVEKKLLPLIADLAPRLN